MIIIGTSAHDIVGHPVAIERTALLDNFRIVFGLVALGSVAAFFTMVVMEERPLLGPSGAHAEPFSVGE